MNEPKDAQDIVPAVDSGQQKDKLVDSPISFFFFILLGLVIGTGVLSLRSGIPFGYIRDGNNVAVFATCIIAFLYLVGLLGIFLPQSIARLKFINSGFLRNFALQSAGLAIVTGVFFTFLGIAYSLNDWTQGNSEVNIAKVVSSLKVSIWSSVCGALASILLRTALSWSGAKSESHKAISSLGDSIKDAMGKFLNDLPKILENVAKTLDRINDSQTKLNEQLGQLVGLITDNAKAISTLTESTTSLNEPVAQLSENLAASVVQITETKDALDEVPSLLKDFNLALETLQTTLGDFSDVALHIDAVLEKFEAMPDKITESVNKAITNSIEMAKEELRQMFGESISNFQQALADLTEEFQNRIAKIHENAAEKLKDELIKATQESINALGDNLTERLNKAVDEVANRLETRTGALLSSIDSMIKSMNEAIESLKQSAEYNAQIIGTLELSAKQLQKIHEQLEAVAPNIQKAGQEAVRTVRDLFTQMLSDLNFSELKGGLNSISDDLSKIARKTSDLKKDLEDDTNSIFNFLDRELKSLAHILGATLNDLNEIKDSRDKLASKTSD